MEIPSNDNESQSFSNAKSTVDSLSLTSQVIDQNTLKNNVRMININPPVDQSSLTIAEIISENKIPLNIPLIKIPKSNSKRSRKQKETYSSSEVSNRSSNSNNTKKQRISEKCGEKIAKNAESTNANITSSSFTNKKTTSKWTTQESRKFFKAVELFGTDFSLILGMFPERSRTQLKNKYRKEERKNRPMLEEALKKNRNMKLKRLTERMNKVKAQYGEIKEAEQKEILSELKRTRLSSFNSVDSMDMVYLK